MYCSSKRQSFLNGVGELRNMDTQKDYIEYHEELNASRDLSKIIVGEALSINCLTQND